MIRPGNGPAPAHARQHWVLEEREKLFFLRYLLFKFLRIAAFAIGHEGAQEKTEEREKLSLLRFLRYLLFKFLRIAAFVIRHEELQEKTEERENWFFSVTSCSSS